MADCLALRSREARLTKPGSRSGPASSAGKVLIGGMPDGKKVTGASVCMHVYPNGGEGGTGVWI